MGKNIPKERKEGMYKAILELKSLGKSLYGDYE